MENRIMTFRDCNTYLYTNKTPVNKCIWKIEATNDGAEFNSPWGTFVDNRLVRFKTPLIDNVLESCFLPFDDMTIRVSASADRQRYDGYTVQVYSSVSQFPTATQANSESKLVCIDTSDTTADGTYMFNGYNYVGMCYRSRETSSGSGVYQWQKWAGSQKAAKYDTTNPGSGEIRTYTDQNGQYPVWFQDQIAAGYEYVIYSIVYEQGNDSDTVYDDWIYQGSQAPFLDDTSSSTYISDAVGTSQNPVASFAGGYYYFKENHGKTRKAKMIIQATKRWLSWYSGTLSDMSTWSVTGHAIGSSTSISIPFSPDVCEYFVVNVVQYGEKDTDAQPDATIASTGSSVLTLEITPESGKDVDFALWSPANETGGGYWYKDGVYGSIDPNYQSMASVTKSGTTTTVMLDPRPFYNTQTTSSNYAHFYLYGTQCGYEDGLASLSSVTNRTTNISIVVKDNSTVILTISATVDAQGSLNIDNVSQQQMSVCCQNIIDIKFGQKPADYSIELYKTNDTSDYYNKGISTKIYPVGIERLSTDRTSTSRKYTPISLQKSSLPNTQSVQFLQSVIKPCDADIIGYKIELVKNTGEPVDSSFTYTYNVNGNTLSRTNPVYYYSTSGNDRINIQFTSSNVPNGDSPTIYFKVTQLASSYKVGYTNSMALEYAIIAFTFNE